MLSSGSSPPLTPARWDAWYGIGFILELTGHSDSALSAYARSLELWPESYWTWFELGLHSMDNWVAALRADHQENLDHDWSLAMHAPAAGAQIPALAP